MMKTTFTILGMTCDACAKRNEHALQESPGVISAIVDFPSESAKVEYDETLITEEQFKKLVEGLGFRASLASDPKLSEEQIKELPQTDRIQINREARAEGTLRAWPQGATEFTGNITVTTKCEVDPKSLKEGSDIVSAFQKVFQIGSGLERVDHYASAPSAPTSEKLSETSAIAITKEARANDAPISQEKRTNFHLYGMHCASCAGLIERKIKKLPGVKEARVNYGAEGARRL